VHSGSVTGFRIAQAGKLASLTLAVMTVLAGCSEDGRLPSNSRHYVPISPKMEALMSEKGMNARSPILLRAYKAESELEVWKQDSQGQYKLLKSFPMCRWSGQLGPKKVEGDRQVPEGFYSVTPAQLNPNSSYYLSFNVGYPNAYDRSLGRTGAHIMVHGACSSMGCFSMTDEQVADIYALAREAFGGGQKAIQMQSLPFRMTAQNLAKYRSDENMPFWKNLKEGSDHFDVTKREPQVAVCGRRYVFNAQAKDGGRFDAASACPPFQQDESVASAVRDKNQHDEQQVAQLIHSGVKPVKRIYQDGDQHPSFKHSIYAQVPVADPARQATIVPQGASKVAEVSRPDALDTGAVELPHEQTKGLNRQQLLAKAQAAKQQELAVLAAPATTTTAAAPAAAAVAPKAAAQPAKANAAQPAKAIAAAPAPATAASASALVATEPAAKKEDPAFYQKWMGTLGSLTASSSEATEVAPQAVQAPAPPKAPKR